MGIIYYQIIFKKFPQNNIFQIELPNIPIINEQLRLLIKQLLSNSIAWSKILNIQFIENNYTNNQINSNDNINHINL